ncbi:hypothetical protein GCM10011574_42980 [Microbispora bryophytorum]|uniref:Uncharacterized protein n=1 Tax=Microbispora bryophytorum TaxID=1460882 RepID=A0A8H9H4T4_9ACTN|nr:hypothetical protein GCM10011574_42980 [Microbispora bryophytorum]
MSQTAAVSRYRTAHSGGRGIGWAGESRNVPTATEDVSPSSTIAPRDPANTDSDGMLAASPRRLREIR